MSKSIWATALLLLLPGATGAVSAETIQFPSFVHAGRDVSVIFAPKCVVTGNQMKCDILYASAFPWEGGGAEGRCYLQLASQALSFKRTNANTWRSEVPIEQCRGNTVFEFTQVTEAPKRVTLRITVEISERTEDCLKEVPAPIVLEWKEGATGGLVSFPMPAVCKSWVTEAGDFPSQAFPR